MDPYMAHATLYEPSPVLSTQPAADDTRTTGNIPPRSIIEKPCNWQYIETGRPLPEGYQPSKYDVICQRGKHAMIHEGNNHFRQLLQQYLPQYSKAIHKWEKTALVTNVVQKIKLLSPNGGFIRKIGVNWHELSDQASREKVGQTLRDLLHDKYRSSTKAKARQKKILTVSGVLPEALPDQRSLHGLNRNNPLSRVDGETKPPQVKNAPDSQPGYVRDTWRDTSADKRPRVSEFAFARRHSSASSGHSRHVYQANSPNAITRLDYQGHANHADSTYRSNKRKNPEDAATLYHVPPKRRDSHPAYRNDKDAESHRCPSPLRNFYGVAQEKWRVLYEERDFPKGLLGGPPRKPTGQVQRELNAVLDSLFPPPDLEKLHKLSVEGVQALEQRAWHNTYESQEI